MKYQKPEIEIIEIENLAYTLLQSGQTGDNPEGWDDGWSEIF